MQETKEILRSFITETFPAASAMAKFDDVMSFLDTGLIDSTGVLELVDFLEEQFEISVEDSELVPRNLDSISNICKYVESKGVTATEI